MSTSHGSNSTKSANTLKGLLKDKKKDKEDDDNKGEPQTEAKKKEQ